MNPIVDGEPAGFSPGPGLYTMLGKDDFSIVVPQASCYATHIDMHSVTSNCTFPSMKCRHKVHIREGSENLSDIAAVLNTQFHVSRGALDYCNLIYHTLIGSLKDQPNKNTSDLITKLEDLQRQVQQLSSRVGDVRLSKKDIDQISSKIGIVVSGNVLVPTADEIASKMKVPSAREITEEIGELSLNEFTKADLVNRISKFIPASGIAKDIADKISIPEIKVPTAAEIASHIKDLASQIKIPSAKEFANQIDYNRIASEIANQMDYKTIASEVASRINLPDAKSIDISSLAKQIADHIPKCDPAAIAGNIHFHIPSFPTAQEIASQIRLDIPTAQEIANKLAEAKPDMISPDKLYCGLDYTEKLKEIDRKCEKMTEIDRKCEKMMDIERMCKDIITALQGNVG